MIVSDTFLSFFAVILTGNVALSAQDPGGNFCDCLEDCESNRGRDFHNITLTGEHHILSIHFPLFFFRWERNYEIARGQASVISGKKGRGKHVTRIDDNHPLGNEIAPDL